MKTWKRYAALCMSNGDGLAKYAVFSFSSRSRGEEGRDRERKNGWLCCPLAGMRLSRVKRRSMRTGAPSRLETRRRCRRRKWKQRLGQTEIGTRSSFHQKVFPTHRFGRVWMSVSKNVCLTNRIARVLVTIV